MQISLLSAVGGSPLTLGYFSLPGGYEWIVILALALLFFGKRLPAAARGIGQSLVEFKRGMKSGERGDADPADAADPKRLGPTSTPKFDPYTGRPVEPTANA